jgi:hypothetical protein
MAERTPILEPLVLLQTANSTQSLRTQIESAYTIASSWAYKRQLRSLDPDNPCRRISDDVCVGAVSTMMQ